MTISYLLNAHLSLLSGGDMLTSCSPPGELRVDPIVVGVCAPSAELVGSVVEAIAVGVCMQW